MIFTAKKKNNTHVAIQAQAFSRKPKRLRLFSHNKKAFKASTEVKETASVITTCQKPFAET